MSIGYRGDDAHVGIDGRSNLSNTTLSYLQETGDPISNIPPRPFILQSLRAINAFERISAYVRDNPDTTPQTLQPFVDKLVAECKQFVKDGGVTPELEDSTVTRRLAKAKRHGKMLASTDYPLYETGELIEALTGWVSRKR